MYGAITGKVVLTGVIVILCVLRIFMVLYTWGQQDRQNRPLTTIIHIIIPIAVSYVLCRWLW